MTEITRKQIDSETEDVWLKLWAYVWQDAVVLSNNGNYASKIELLAYFGQNRITRMYHLGLINWDPQSVPVQMQMEVA